MESVILENPILIIGLIIALTVSVFGIVKKVHIAVNLTGAAIYIVTAVYSLLLGAGLYEVGAVTTVFLIINLLPLWKKGGE